MKTQQYNALFVICVSGFTQHAGYFHGILKLREQLLDAGFANGSHQRVIYLTWKADFHRVAQELSIVCNHQGFKPAVVLAGYSYGGWGAIQLASQLERVGIDVFSLVLSDPVGRQWWWPRPLPAITSMLGRNNAFKLDVPANVHRCVSFYQTVNRPQGHQLRPANGTKMVEPVQLAVTHQRMDDAEQFHQAVLAEANSASECVYKEAA